MDIRIASIKKIYADMKSVDLSEPTSAILCTSYDLRNMPPNGLHILPLYFDDFTDAKRVTAFQPTQADAVRNFILSMPEKTSVLYICCDQGESRSTAICAAILRWRGRSDRSIWQNPHYHSNPLVYRLQCKALGVQITGISIRYRLWISRRTFARSIKLQNL